MEEKNITIMVREEEIEVTEKEFEYLKEIYGTPTEKISNCCGAVMEEDICTDCLEHCKPIYIFG